MRTILVINAGSSSIKFQVFAIQSGSLTAQIKGQLDGIGSRPRLRATGAEGQLLADLTLRSEEASDVPAGLQLAAAWLREEHTIDPIAVGHRVVHGGPDYDRPVLVDRAVLSRLERYMPLAPLHQPNNLAPIRTLLERLPHLAQVACFDTAFHRTHSAVADHFAIPEQLYTEGVRRYGFHGLSYEYIANQLPAIAPGIAGGRIIVAHLGSGASMCALSGGRSVESTMGFTALDGLPMGTRPGQIDPGVVLYLIAQKGMTVSEVQHLLYQDCGMKGLSGVSNDMRQLLTSDNAQAAFAIEYFVHRAALSVGMLAAALGGVDGFVFTAGIGENSPEIRARIVEKLRWLGLALDSEANSRSRPLISQPNSLPIHVIPTNEELMIARHTLTLVARSGAKQQSSLVA
jgi:acetate kinase